MTPNVLNSMSRTNAIEDLHESLRSGRLVSVFANKNRDHRLSIHYMVDTGASGYRCFEFAADRPVPSITALTPAAAWYEREVHDQYGIEILGHPDLRPLLLHENWPANVHPMVTDVTSVPWASGSYPFLEVQGDGVCEVAVGPVHAGIIEPGHFRFSVMGDRVIHLELRHFYTHKGTEKLFEQSPVPRGALIAESVSGDNCFAHAVAYCQAVENAFGVEVPRRATFIRLIGLELERLLAHVADVGALCGDVGFAVPAAYASRIKEDLLRVSAASIGTRYWRGVATPGGVKRDFSSTAASDLASAVERASREFSNLAQKALDTASVQNRFEGVGVLVRDVARDLAVVGPVARASGIDVDVRRDHPYGPYTEHIIDVPVLQYGDVLARARVRIEEAAVSARLIVNIATDLAAGPICAGAADWGRDAQGFSAVESPRGELLYWISCQQGQLARCHVKSPSFQNWTALPFVVADNIIADFPLINKSFNLSYSGCDR
jgi:Ni,Fe-hydrogenase III large subunit/Ni,Fe-hydrogenase III component G